jgi:hypothetical protein
MSEMAISNSYEAIEHPEGLPNPAVANLSSSEQAGEVSLLCDDTQDLRTWQ